MCFRVPEFEPYYTLTPFHCKNCWFVKFCINPLFRYMFWTKYLKWLKIKSDWHFEAIEMYYQNLYSIKKLMSFYLVLLIPNNIISRCYWDWYDCARYKRCCWVIVLYISMSRLLTQNTFLTVDQSSVAVTVNTRCSQAVHCQ